eukprot:COSAG04_NODE_6965_length_1219_cov_1.188393_1_plen_75_part_10
MALDCRITSSVRRKNFATCSSAGWENSSNRPGSGQYCVTPSVLPPGCPTFASCKNHTGFRAVPCEGRRGGGAELD